MLILQNILSQEIVQKLGWTLLHFIWQASAVALILAILLRLLRKSTANLRYIIACLALALIVLLPVITIKLVPVSQPLTAAHFAPAPEPTVLPAVEMPAPETTVIAKPSPPEIVTVAASVPLKQRAVDMLEPALPYIVSGWLIGVFALSIWHLGGWTQLQRLKRRMVKQVDSTLNNKLKVLNQRLKVKQTVQLMESALVQIPTVVGWLRPVILLPASALTGLNAEQLEAIIAHELAHIKRFDYLVNILQTIVEILGFYHPAVWWTSHKIRAERENCCDDMAVSISGDRLSYAGALASMEEIRTGRRKLAVAASGGNLFRRICRLLGKDSTDNTGLSWVPAATAILLIIALAIPTTLALTNKSEPEQAKSKIDSNKFLTITCTGRIVDSKGDAVASAMVEAYETYFDRAGNLKLRLIGKSVTKDDGKFSFKTTPTVKKNRSDGGLVIAQKESLAIGWANWPLYDGNQKTKIILQEPTKLSGRIVDDNGKPVPNAEVRAVLFEDKTLRDGIVSWLPGIQPSDCLSIHTDRNGRFEFDNIPQNVSSDLLVTAPGFGTIYSRKPNRIDKGYEWAEFKAGQTDIKITVAPEAGIVGKLVDKKTGKGKAGITLRVIPHFTPVFFERYLCTTQKDGTFSIGGLRTGKYVIMRAGSRNLKVDVEVESGKTKRNVILKYPSDIRSTKSAVSKPAENIPSAPVLAASPPPPDNDKAHVRADFLAVEVSLDSKLGREALKEAQKILGNKVNFSNTKVNAILRQVVKATAAAKDKSAENKRVTARQFKAFIDTLISKGYMKILMNPMIETISGKTATIRSAQHVPLKPTTRALPDGGQLNLAATEIKYVDVVDSIEITPHVLADGQISLDVKADLGSQDIPLHEEPTKPAPVRKLSTHVRANSGETVIIGGLIDNHSAIGGNVKGSEMQAKEVLFIITPTIVTPPADSPKTAKTQIDDKRVLSAQKLKQLGLAVAMYAEDHDEVLPHILKELKSYIQDEDVYDWTLDNVEYFDKGRTAQRNAAYIPIAYDKTLLKKADGTNILSLDFSVRFVDKKEFEKLDFKRTEFLIDAKFLSVSEDFLKNINHNADSPDEAKELLKLKSELLADADDLKAQNSTPDGRNVNLLLSRLDGRNANLFLKAVRAHKDSKVLAAPQVLCREDKTAEINVMNKETYFIVGYTEPNSPSEKPEPKLDKVEEGIYLSLRPTLTPNKNIYVQCRLEITNILDSEERKFRGKAPYKPPKVLRRAQTLSYRVQNDETFLFGGHKIADPQDGQTEQKDLLVLIKAHTIDPSEEDKPDKTENLIVTKPPTTTTNVITPSAIAKSRTESPKDNEQEKTKSATEQPKIIEILFKLKHHNSSQMAQIVKPLLTNTGHVSTDERTNSLLVVDTAENLKRIEKIITDFDVSKPAQTITEIFEIRHGDPTEIVETLKKLINGRPDNGAIIEQGKKPIVLIPEPVRKWIIAKASAEDIKQIGQWIEKLDTDKSTIGLEPLDAAVHEQLEMIVDLSDLAPQMSFAEVVEILENSVEPPLLIQPIWKDLLENAEVEQATQAGMDPLPGIKLRKALEILLTSVSSTQLPKLTYIVDDGVILIGTAEMLTLKLDGLPSFPDELPEPNLSPAPKVKLISNTFIDCPLLEALEYIAAAANVNIITDETVKGSVSCKLKDVAVETALDILLAGTPYVWKKTPHYYLVASAAEPPEITKRIKSAKKLSNLGKALLEYANDYADKYPVSLHHLQGYLKVEEYKWALANVEYLAHGKKLADRPDTVLAYDRTLLPEGKGTNVLYNDFHVSFEKAQELKKLGISESEILIETKLLSVNEDFLKAVGLDANTENFSEAWTKLLTDKYPAVQNDNPYGIIIDDLHVTFLLKSIQAHHDSKILAAPRVSTREGETASITIGQNPVIINYPEPNKPFERKIEQVEIGTHIWITPKLAANEKMVDLDFKLEMRQFKGFKEGKYKKPIVDVINLNVPCTIPKGKTMLIGGLKINEKVKKEPSTFIGGLFKRDTIKNDKMLLILVKPVINPQQKAAKTLPGQEDSEEHIQRLAEQLEKKLNRPAD